MSIGAYCRRDVATIDQDQTIHAAAVLMEERSLGCLLVTGGGGRPWGLITDRDLALRTIGGQLDPKQTRVAAVTELSLISIHEHLPVRVASLLMERSGVRRLPVLDAKDELVGIVAWDDLLGLFARELAEVASAAAAQTPRFPIPASRALSEITYQGVDQ